MDYDRFLAPGVRDLQPVAIREVMELIADRDAVSLAGGWPDPATFPIDALADLLASELREQGPDVLQYSTTRGLPGLRAAIADRLETRHGMDVSPDEVLVTTGSQQGLYLAARAFVGDGARIGVGAPTYVAALTAIRRAATPAFVSVPLDDDGMDLDRLAGALDREPVDLVYVVPTHQNPTGVTMSRARRERLAALAVEHDFLVVEDQPYAELSYDGDPPPPVARFAPERTVLLGSFSKVLAPGLRVGWMAADEALIERFALLKQPVDLHTSTLCQHLALAALRTGLIDDGLSTTTDRYARRRDAALAALEREMPDYVSWTRPGGGMFLWLTLPDPFDTRALLPAAIDNGVAYVPGHAFYADRPRHDTLRVNFTGVGTDALALGIRRLAGTIRAAEADAGA